MVKWLLKAGTVALGTLLGPACGGGSKTMPLPEYGVPHATFKLDGTVVDSAAATAIQRIQVSLGGSLPNMPVVAPAAVSDPQGQWHLEASAFPCGGSCFLTAHDPGDAPGGPYADKVVPIDPAKALDASGNWDGDTYEQHGIQIPLDKK